MHNSREAVEKAEHSAKSRFIDLRDESSKLLLQLNRRQRHTETAK